MRSSRRNENDTNQSSLVFAGHPPSPPSKKKRREREREREKPAPKKEEMRETE